MHDIFFGGEKCILDLFYSGFLFCSERFYLSILFFSPMHYQCFIAMSFLALYYSKQHQLLTHHLLTRAHDEFSLFLFYFTAPVLFTI
jgi:hypothetical protein